MKREGSMSLATGYCTACGKEMFANARFCTYCGTEQPMGRESRTAPFAAGVSEIRRVGVWSLVKFFFMIHAIFGLFFGILIVAVGMSGIPIHGMDELFPIETIPWVGIIVVIPLIYGLIGAVLGLFVGSSYNLLAWGVGGIRITLKQT
jgi:hypothetical protein